jgi:wyosine [tRNA(Phe)-imidazoG37] synthetase (radical SAM superfamily)
LGRTKPVVNERKAYFPQTAIMAQMREALAMHKPGDIDWVTFVGSGEPTLHTGIGWLIREVKALTDLPVAVITNGALLHLPEVREELTVADSVMPSLDAGTPDLYHRINRPHPQTTFDRLLEGLIAFRHDYDGKLWIEVMLVRGFNDTEQALLDIASNLRRIHPDEVHISLPTRPPAETWVQPADQEGLMRARAILGDVAHVIHPIEGQFDLSGYDNLIDALVAIITRHPMCERDIVQSLERQAPGESKRILQGLEESGQAQAVERLGMRFWSAAPSYYPSESHSRSVDPRRHR